MLATTLYWLDGRITVEPIHADVTIVLRLGPDCVHHEFRPTEESAAGSRIYREVAPHHLLISSASIVG
jgi:hypothetical protein